MQRLCCADVSDLNRAVYTGMLNERGGYETDCTVTRLGESEFLVVSPTAQATRDADWIRRNIENWNMNDTTTVRDISSSMCVLALMGPRSRDLLSEVMLQTHSRRGCQSGENFKTSQEEQCVVRHLHRDVLVCGVVGSSSSTYCL